MLGRRHRNERARPTRRRRLLFAQQWPRDRALVRSVARAARFVADPRRDRARRHRGSQRRRRGAADRRLLHVFQRARGPAARCAAAVHQSAEHVEAGRRAALVPRSVEIGTARPDARRRAGVEPPAASDARAGAAAAYDDVVGAVSIGMAHRPLRPPDPRRDLCDARGPDPSLVAGRTGAYRRTVADRVCPALQAPRRRNDHELSDALAHADGHESPSSQRGKHYLDCLRARLRVRKRVLHRVKRAMSCSPTQYRRRASATAAATS